MTPAQVLPPPSRRRWALVVSIAAATLLGDLALPLGVAAGVPYVLAILLTMDRGDSEMTRGVAIGCGMLVVLGWMLSEHGSASWMANTNRLLSLVAIGATALAVLRSKRLRLALADEVTAHHAAQQELLKSEAMARLGEMATVVAHEVKNPLTGISTALTVLSDRLPLSDGEVRLFGTMQGRLTSLDAILEDLLVYARPRVVEVLETDMCRLLNDVAGQLAALPAFEHVQIRVVACDPVTLRADPSLITDAVRHLALNAAQAMGGRGEIELSAATTGGQVTVTVADDGPGIPADLRERVLEPFFTTRSRGTGLGLAIARRCAEVHEGDLRLRSPDDGSGTIAELVLSHARPV